MRRYPPRQPKAWKGRPAARRFIYERDHGICQECLQPVAFEAFEVDHIIPRAYGGTDESSNLRLTCRPCNQAKRDH